MRNGVRATMVGTMVLAIGVASAWAGPPAHSGGEEMGLALAMSGDVARAESMFVSMLSHTRGDSRALNNLGNLRLLRGDIGVALAFYDRAARGDSTDAGIQLNRATTLMLMGDEDRAREAAALGVQLAGGVAKAQELLGLAPAPGEKSRAADAKAYINRGELRDLLNSAAAGVPRDTTSAKGIVPGAAGAHRKAPTWRSAGPRAADQSDAANLLYWKR